MFALKSHRLGKTKKQSDVARITEPNPDDEIDDTVKTRFQEIGPQFTLKMRWIRRGQLGETGHEREAREKHEAATGEQATEFGERAEGGDGEDDELAEGGAEDEDGMEMDDEDLHDEGEDDDAEAEAAAKKAIGLDETDAAGQPNFTNLEDPTAAVESEAAGKSAFAEEPLPSSAIGDNSKKRPRSTPRVRKKPYHALLNPPPDSESDSPEPEAVPLPMAGKKKNPELKSAFDTVGHTWHAGKGEGGVREGAKRREWNWDVSPFRRPGAILLHIADVAGTLAGSYASLAAQVLPLSRNLLHVPYPSLLSSDTLLHISCIPTWFSLLRVVVHQWRRCELNGNPDRKQRFHLLAECWCKPPAFASLPLQQAQGAQKRLSVCEGCPPLLLRIGWAGSRGHARTDMWRLPKASSESSPDLGPRHRGSSIAHVQICRQLRYG